MPLLKEEFQFMKDLVRQTTGIDLEPDKEYLVESRLTALVYKEGLSSIEHLLNKVKAEGPSSLIYRKVVESMLTTETYFFRDDNPFTVFKKHVIPYLMESRALLKSFNIWCGACSTGQEPYSLSMILHDQFPELNSWRYRIVATDLSEENIEKCKAGRYSPLQVSRGLGADNLKKHFEQMGLDWELKENIRSMVEFQKMNLFDSYWNIPKPDVVFLRNVLIYFEAEKKQEILSHIKSIMAPDGFLFLGSCETTVGLDPDFEPIYLENTVYFRIKKK